MNLSAGLDARYRLSIEEYELLLKGEEVVRFGTRDATPNHDILPNAWARYQGGGRLALRRMDGYHRKYEWA
jgi:polyketide biosynthesis 3-hydroxy-3-methylglutaryl-CoA synthase-like enzyme PksG